MKRALSLALLAAALCAASVAAAQPAPLAGFDDYVGKNLAAFAVPGVAVAVVKDDQVVLARGYGVRAIGRAAKVDEHTLFAIGSCSKAFTATLLAMLIDDGKLAWDDPVSQHLPDFALYDPYVTREITVRDLLTHRSGLGGADLLWYANGYDRKEVVRRIRFLKPASSFRSTWAYQNVMFIVAGQVAAAAGGRSWDELVAQRIFAPLGMRDSNTSVKSLRGGRDVAAPHAEIGEEVVAIPWHDIDDAGPAGSINASAADMAQWLRLQLGGGRFGGKQLVSAAAVQEMQSPQMVIKNAPFIERSAPGARFLTYGLGWLVNDYGGAVVVQHNGNIDGMSATVVLLPAQKAGVVVLANLDSTPLPTALAFRVIDAYLGKEPRDWAAESLRSQQALADQAVAAEKKQQAARVANTRPSLPLAAYAGTYTHELYGDITVALEQGKLVMRYGALAADLEHWHYDTFRAVFRTRNLGEGLVVFALGTDGKVAEIRSELGADLTFERKPAPPAAVKLADLRKLTGQYHLAAPRLDGTVELVGSGLQLTVPGQPTYKLTPLSATRFQVAGVPEEIFLTFEVVGGAAVSMTVEQGGRIFKLVR